MLQRYLILWLTLTCAVAAACDHWLPTPWDPFKLSGPILKYLFALTMFAVGALLPADELKEALRRWPWVLGGTLTQFAWMPLMAYLLARTAGLSDDLLLGVIMVGCVPGAMASNVLTLASRGNVSYSVCLTTTATLCSPLIVPLTLYLAVRVEGIDRSQMAVDAFQSLLLQVVGPVLAGRWLASVWPAFARLMQRCGANLANAVIIWIIAFVVNASAGRLESLTWVLPAVLLGLNLSGYVGGYLSSRGMRLPDSMRRALILEIGMQNAGLGTILAKQLFSDRPLVQLPPALYTFGCMLTGAVLAQIWSRSEPTDLAADTEAQIQDASE